MIFSATTDEYCLGLCIAFFLALLMASYHTIRAATANPVDSLRYK
jgi:ABC-type lipoprotein release transport system permease subunit